MNKNSDDDAEAQACKDALIAEARSIQKLLVNYQHTQEALKKDVDEFVKRDLEEDIRGHELYNKVAQREMELCQNTHFLRFEKEKGNMDCVIPTRRMRDRPSPAANPSRKDGLADLLTTSKICSVCSELSDHLPSAAVQLRDFGDFVEGLLGWRSHDKHFNIEAQNLCDVLFSQCSGSCVSCINGIPLTPAFLKGSPPASKFKEELVETLKSQLKSAPFNLLSSVAIQVYQNILMHYSALLKTELLETLTQHAEMQVKSSSPDGASGLSLLTGDVYDSIVLVEKSKLSDVQLFRGFFFMSELRVIEHLGPEVEIMSLLCTPENSALKDIQQKRAEIVVEEQKRLKETFCDAFCKMTSNRQISTPDKDGRTISNRNVCLVLAVQREHLCGAPRHQRYVLMDMHPIAPTLPFYWQLSWEELCSVGQRGKGAPGDVLFKCSRVSGTELIPYDDMSTQYFPIINRLIER